MSATSGYTNCTTSLQYNDHRKKMFRTVTIFTPEIWNFDDGGSIAIFCVAKPWYWCLQMFRRNCCLHLHDERSSILIITGYCLHYHTQRCNPHHNPTLNDSTAAPNSRDSHCLHGIILIHGICFQTACCSYSVSRKSAINVYNSCSRNIKRTDRCRSLGYGKVTQFLHINTSLSSN